MSLGTDYDKTRKSVKPISSATPKNLVLGSIDGPLLDVMAKSGVTRYMRLVNDMKLRLDRAGYVRGVQNGAAIYGKMLKADLVSTDQKLVEKTMSLVKDYALHYADLVQVNLKSGNGGYIPKAQSRVPEAGTGDMDPIKNASQICKCAIVSLADTEGKDVFDLGPGNGNLVERMVRMNQINFRSYLGVDSDVHGKLKNFDTVTANARFLRLNIGVIKSDFNIWIQGHVHDPRDVYFSVNSFYYMDHLLCNRVFASPFFGLLNVSDLLFLEHNVIKDKLISLTMDERSMTMTGSITGFPVDSEKLVFADDVCRGSSFFYPARFIYSARKLLEGNSAYMLNSMGIIIPKPACDTIPESLGKMVYLVPTDSSFDFKRPSMKGLTFAEAYFYSKTGCFCSNKINGIGAFLTFVDGEYCIYLRDGSCFTPIPEDGETLNLGAPIDPIFLEMVPYEKKVMLIFNDSAVPKFSRDERSYWRERFHDFNFRMREAKIHYPDLYFKQYVWIPPGVDLPNSNDFSLSLSFNGVVPSDGVIVNCPFGQQVNFIKPFNTFETVVSRSGNNYLSSSGVVSFQDPSLSGIGLYECYLSDGKVVALIPRHDKIESSAFPCRHRSDFFSYHSSLPLSFNLCQAKILLPSLSMSRIHADLFVLNKFVKRLYESFDGVDISVLLRKIYDRLDHRFGIPASVVYAEFVDLVREETVLPIRRILKQFCKVGVLTEGCLDQASLVSVYDVLKLSIVVGLWSN